MKEAVCYFTFWYSLLLLILESSKTIYVELLAYILMFESEKWKLSHVRLCDHVDCSPPGSTVHGILQARVLEWVAISFSRGSSRLRDQTQVSCIAGRLFDLWATREAY